MDDQENFSSFKENIEVVKAMDAFMRNGDSKNIFDLLIQHPALLNLRCYNTGDSGLITFAASLGSLEIAQFLLDHGADINEYEKYRNTPLHQAVLADHVEMVKWLLINNALPDGPIQCLYTPLHEASTSGKIACAELLITYGADINRLNLRTNKTPLDVAITWKQQEMESLLRSKGAIDTVSGNNWSHAYGGPILEFIENTLGRVIPTPHTEPTESFVIQYVALANKENNKVLFTIGLFAKHTPMIELFIVLPAAWNMYDTSEKNQFPSAILQLLGNQFSNGEKIEEGLCIMADDPRYKDLAWPKQVAGLCVSDNDWGVDRSHEKRISEEEKVWLMTLIPIKRTKNGWSKQSIEKNRTARWTKLALG